MLLKTTQCMANGMVMTTAITGVAMAMMTITAATEGMVTAAMVMEAGMAMATGTTNQHPHHYINKQAIQQNCMACLFILYHARVNIKKYKYPQQENHQ